MKYAKADDMAVDGAVDLVIVKLSQMGVSRSGYDMKRCMARLRELPNWPVLCKSLIKHERRIYNGLPG